MIGAAERWKAAWTAGLAVALVSASAPAEPSREPLPSAPLQPTRENCRALRLRFNDVLLGLHDEMRACLDRGPNSGEADVCGDYRLHAYVDCVPIRNEICRVNDVEDREVARCRSRIAERPAEPEGAAPEEARSLRRRAGELVDFVSDPRDYLGSALEPFPDTMDRLFGPRRDRFDRDLGEAFYRYAHERAESGLRITRNPLVRRIQRSALDRIGEFHESMLAELDRIAARIRRFRAEPSGETAGGAARPSPTPSVGAPSGDCAYNREQFRHYLEWCPSNDGCTRRERMKAIVSESCR